MGYQWQNPIPLTNTPQCQDSLTVVRLRTAFAIALNATVPQRVSNLKLAVCQLKLRHLMETYVWLFLIGWLSGSTESGRHQWLVTLEDLVLITQ